jgi:hypothetical protein
MMIVISLFLSLSAYSQDKKAVKHNLKSVVVTEQKYEKGTPGKAVMDSETRYDKSGNVTEEIEYKLGKVVKHMVYQYDGDNQRIRETELDASGKKIKITEYKYTDGLKTEKTVYDANSKTISKKIYKYETF